MNQRLSFITAIIKSDHRFKDELIDKVAVDIFAQLMKNKLIVSRDKGRHGWWDEEECTVEYLNALLKQQVEKGDMVDIANLAMMIKLRELIEGEHH